MISPADSDQLASIVDEATFSRGADYAAQGRVIKRTISANGNHLIGEVAGGARKPYVVTVNLKRGAGGELVDVASRCSCPQAFDCKHVVALLLAPEDLEPQRPRLEVVGAERMLLAPAAEEPVSWESSLERFLSPTAPATVPGIGLALGFELVVPGGDRAELPGIEVRPLLAGKRTGWNRSGISWVEIEHSMVPHDRSGPNAEQLRLLRELLALSRAATTGRLLSDVVRLEQIGSRRLFDLLADLQRLGVALVEGERGLGTVRLSPTQAVLTVDVTRRDRGLHVEPRVEVDGRPIALARSLLVGSPASGIAWWTDTPRGPKDRAGLCLAPLSAPVDDKLRAFLRVARFDVPQGDVKRFTSSFLVDLAQKVAVASSDGSVVLPESRPPVLRLSIEADANHVVRFSWGRGTVGTTTTERLWVTPLRDLHPEEQAAIEAATAVVAQVPGLITHGVAGPRLLPVAQLAGVAAAKVMAEVVPQLRRIEHLEVDQRGTVLDYREATEAPVVVMDTSASSQGDWLDLGVTVTVGGETVPFAELLAALAHRHGELLLPSGTYFSLDTEELIALGKLIIEARSLTDPEGSGVRINRYQLGLFEDLARLGVISTQAAAWREALAQLTVEDAGPSQAPAGLEATLRPYQLDGYRWLSRLHRAKLGGVLGDDMGLGKTLQALALMVEVTAGDPEQPFLVVAPTSVVSNWEHEARRFAPGLKVVSITETASRRSGTIAEHARGANLVVTSYALFRLEAEQYGEVAWAAAFFDEAQFVKNRQSKAYACAKALPVACKVAMSGTPIENNLMELWSLLSIASPGLFPDPERFAEYYRLPIERNADREKLDQLRQRIRPFLLRRTKEAVAEDLPEKQEQVLEVELNPTHRKLYQMYLNRERQKVLGLLDELSTRRFEIFRSLTLLRQASLDIALLDPSQGRHASSKLDVLSEMLAEIVADGHRVLVFSQFTSFLALAKERIDEAGIASCYLDGSTRRRGEVLEEFRSGKAPVFLISLKAGGFGLNLTEADYAILLDPWWNPATEAQAVDRIHRIGQQRKVMVYRLVARDTLEEKVMALKAQKAQLFDSVFGEGDFTSTAISREDIEVLLS